MSKSKYFFFFVFMVAILKLVLVAKNEIIAIPYDSEVYVRQAANHLFELGAPPGYPMWLAFSRIIGVPQRILIELLLIGSSFVVSLSLRRICGEISGALSFAMLVLSPATYFMFDYALSDGFYACLGLLAIALSAVTIFARSKKVALAGGAGLGVSMGWMAVTRTEDPLLIAWIVLIVLLRIVYSSRFFKSSSSGYGWMAAKDAVVVGASIAVPVLVLVQAINLMHLNESGVSARTLAGMPGHTRMLRNLAEIDGGESSARYIPISAKARSLAYASSPALEKYRNCVEDGNNVYHVVSRKVGLPSGEIGAGWIWHVFNACVLEANGVKGAEVEYKKINAEIERGFDSGVLRRRFVLHSFATAPISEILSRLPLAAWQAAKKVFQVYPAGTDVGQEKEIFDAVNLRRTVLTATGFKHTVQGWAFVESSKTRIKSVLPVGGVDQRAIKLIYMPRPDVEEGFKENGGRKPVATGFKISFESSSEKVGELLYFMDDGSIVASPGISSGVLKANPGASEGVAVTQGIDFVNVEPAVRAGFGHRTQTYISSIANDPRTSSVLLSALLGLGIIFIAVRYVSEREAQVAIFASLVAALLALRVAFYGVLESEAWGVEVRYMLAGNFMAAILIAVLLPTCIGAIQKLLGKRAKLADSDRFGLSVRS